jgi:hypothetical protein
MAEQREQVQQGRDRTAGHRAVADGEGDAEREQRDKDDIEDGTERPGYRITDTDAGADADADAEHEATRQ